MAKRRDYKAEYARRVARERERGYKGYGEARRARATGRPRPTDTSRGAGKRQIFRRGEQTLYRTTSGGRGWSLLQRAVGSVAPDVVVRMRVTYLAYDATRTVLGRRTIVVDVKAGDAVGGIPTAAAGSVTDAYGRDDGPWTADDVVGVEFVL